MENREKLTIGQLLLMMFLGNPSSLPSHDDHASSYSPFSRNVATISQDLELNLDHNSWAVFLSSFSGVSSSPSERYLKFYKEKNYRDEPFI